MSKDYAWAVARLAALAGVSEASVWADVASAMETNIPVAEALSNIALWYANEAGEEEDVETSRLLEELADELWS
jgi:hypothetical protein